MIADKVSIYKINGYEYHYKEITQLFIMGNHMTVTGVNGSGEISTDKFILKDLRDMKVRFEKIEDF